MKVTVQATLIYTVLWDLYFPLVDAAPAPVATPIMVGPPTPEFPNHMINGLNPGPVVLSDTIRLPNITTDAAVQQQQADKRQTNVTYTINVTHGGNTSTTTGNFSTLGADALEEAMLKEAILALPAIKAIEEVPDLKTKRQLVVPANVTIPMNLTTTTANGNATATATSGSFNLTLDSTAEQALLQVAAQAMLDAADKASGLTGGINPLQLVSMLGAPMGVNPQQMVAEVAGAKEKRGDYDWVNDHIHEADTWLANAITHPHQDLLDGTTDGHPW